MQGIQHGGIVKLLGIQSFKDAVTEEFFEKGTLKGKVGWSKVKSVVMRKLDMLDYADQLQDLNSPPGNRLEALKGNLAGCHSIRVNDQWRIVFEWTTQGPKNVRVVDYH